MLIHIRFYDEGQLETLRDNGDRLGALAVDCITRAGTQLDFKVGLGGDYKTGTSWDQTH